MNRESDLNRIRRMERMFDALSAAHARGEALNALEEEIRELTAYLDGGQWLADYERDERGGWPDDLKRGVLSEDAVYDLFTEIFRYKPLFPRHQQKVKLCLLGIAQKNILA